MTALVMHHQMPCAERNDAKLFVAGCWLFRMNHVGGWVDCGGAVLVKEYIPYVMHSHPEIPSSDILACDTALTNQTVVFCCV